MVTGIDGLLRRPLSRRRLLAGLAGSSAVLLAGCGDDTKNPGIRTGPDESDTADVELLNSMLDLELMAIEAYKTGAARLRGSALQTAKGFLEQEQEHVDTLAAAIRDLDGVPNGPKAAYDLGMPASQPAVLRFAADFENNLVAAYIDVLPKLSQGKIRSTISAILTCEAEHVAVLLGALGEPQVPGAFVVGRAA